MDVTVYGKTALDMMYIEKDLDVHEFIKFREGVVEKKSFNCQERRDIVVGAFIGHIFKLTLKRVQQRNKASTRVLWINLWEETEHRQSLQKLFRSEWSYTWSWWKCSALLCSCLKSLIQTWKCLLLNASWFHFSENNLLLSVQCSVTDKFTFSFNMPITE